MAIIEDYRQIIESVLKSHADLKTNNSDVEYQVIFDTINDHYQLLDVGWEGLKRVYNCYIHLDIKDNKIWIQRNMTEIDIAQ